MAKIVSPPLDHKNSHATIRHRGGYYIGRDTYEHRPTREQQLSAAEDQKKWPVPKALLLSANDGPFSSAGKES